MTKSVRGRGLGDGSGGLGSAAQPGRRGAGWPVTGRGTTGYVASGPCAIMAAFVRASAGVGLRPPLRPASANHAYL